MNRSRGYSTVRHILAYTFTLGLALGASGCLGPSAGDDSDDETTGDVDGSMQRPDGDDQSDAAPPGDIIPFGDSGETGTSDTADGPGGDAGPGDDTNSGCGGRQCGTNAKCVSNTCECKSGYTGDPYNQCTKKMQGNCSSRNDCGQFAVCISGSCKCEFGFLPKSGSKGCKRPSVGNPKNRSKNQVCQRWNKVQSGLTNNLWAQQPQNTCDPGKLKPIVHWEAIRATNGYRWLLGLDPVGSEKKFMTKNQECATMMAANNQLSHNPPSSWQCYTQAGADGAGSSNIAAGAGHPATTVGQYIGDRGNYSTMGHRRWIFSPGMGATGFGHRGRYGCMWTFDRSGSDSQSVIRYPSRGPFPESALRGPWSFFHASIRSFASAKVTVTDTSSGNQLSVSDVSSPQGGYGRIYGVIWRVSGAQAGHTYEIEITNYGSSGNKSTSYKTTLVQCP